MRILADNDEAGARLWSGLLAAGPHLQLIVHDTGCGMSYETMSRMFEPFFTTKDIGAGTGLGLSAIPGIVLRHRGAIVVDRPNDRKSAGRGKGVCVSVSIGGCPIT